MLVLTAEHVLAAGVPWAPAASKAEAGPGHPARLRPELLCRHLPLLHPHREPGRAPAASVPSGNQCRAQALCSCSSGFVFLSFFSGLLVFITDLKEHFNVRFLRSRDSQSWSHGSSHFSPHQFPWPALGLGRDAWAPDGGFPLPRSRGAAALPHLPVTAGAVLWLSRR